jgi:molybdopterin-containing oxidoreductase family iron-sulfur binding subunit
MAVKARNTVSRYNPNEKLTDMYPEPEHPTYRFAMAIDLNRCNGCGACEAACYAENNIAVVGPEQVRMARRMGWIRMSRYWEGSKEHPETPDVRFQPVMCQQCSHAPCEGVCPVLATYHNLDGLNAMIYNRCVGTRYCGNNCPYSARKFNYHTYRWPDSFNLMLNPEVSPREMGVMEKCTFCIQRIRSFKDSKKDRFGFIGSQESGTIFKKANKIEKVLDELKRADKPHGDSEVAKAMNMKPLVLRQLKDQIGDQAKYEKMTLPKLTACAQACPTEAITFGNKNNPNSTVAKLFKHERSYRMLNELNTKPGVTYLAKIVHDKKPPAKH